MNKIFCRMYGVLQKLPKLELTMLTPYKVFYKNFSNFQRIVLLTEDGYDTVGTNSSTRITTLLPGYIFIRGITVGTGNLINSMKGDFAHTGGWVFLHDNNQIEIHLMECIEKDKFIFEGIDKQSTEKLMNYIENPQYVRRFRDSVYFTLFNSGKVF